MKINKLFIQVTVFFEITARDKFKQATERETFLYNQVTLQVWMENNG